VTPERTALFEQAKAAEIEGYSRMSNHDLRVALGLPTDADQDAPASGPAETVQEAKRRLGRRFRHQAFTQGHQ